MGTQNLKTELGYWKWGTIEREEATMTSRLPEYTTKWVVWRKRLEEERPEVGDLNVLNSESLL